jgi:hypothetical protein
MLPTRSSTRWPELSERRLVREKRVGAKTASKLIQRAGWDQNGHGDIPMVAGQRVKPISITFKFAAAENRENISSRRYPDACVRREDPRASCLSPFRRRIDSRLESPSPNGLVTIIESRAVP